MKGVIEMAKKFSKGDKVLCNGYEGRIIREYPVGMYEVRLPGGVVCVDAYEIELIEGAN